MEQQLAGNEFGWWCLCEQGKIWLPEGELPFGHAECFALEGATAQIIGEWQGSSIWLVSQTRESGMRSLRQLIHIEKGLFQLAGRALQLSDFYRSHRFCGHCGSPTRNSETEWACLCTQCTQRYYPQIAPCIIVAIRRGKEILLAKHNRHRGDIYTVLAGFVEVGETLEQAVEREVMEESHLQIKKLQYVTSQPWPFPHSLMAAFIAEYAEGVLQHDPKELLDAGWFHYDQLPQLPPVGTVARRLIEDVVAQCRSEYE